ncbi:C4-dicarboxylic acid transporter DauA [Amphritea sp. 2_MG-2023]|uniref:C4-dicarboxylic acid transporter DauA n=1 Tax=Amphritea TaxID=515417 RepID=UPI001C07874F|nr:MULTISPECIES: C4-dicarboxylic acid transporter DauA [Amphritea]MBU2964049.1 C4-dicarboxylic acid transporter DauA [Amphritea atlantica]MDO6418447.1 C4-dicarboxylic acid transporter DauA [Amphritea sp. 2_MG-2023]
MLNWLLQIPFAAGLRQSIAADYSVSHLRRDLVAGMTVGIIAIPLAMALAIASGVPPQYGLYTCVIAGLVIALTGGSRLSVSGPTAAFVVILYPVTQQFGIAGLLIATIMAGMMMLLMGLARMGKLIEFIPAPVVIGFTAGIAIVIATLQIKDFAGLNIENMPAGYIDKVITLWQALPSYNSSDLLIGLTTLAVLIIWPRLPLRIPGHLFALAAGATVAQWLSSNGNDIATIGTLFSYQDQGQTLPGIPPLAPSFLFPWDLPGPDGKPLILSLSLLQQLFIPALAIALLGAIESLLCAVISDGMSGHRHHANSELVGQGLGNIIAPFFGGITATAAIARTVANYKAGACSPLSAVIHAAVVLLGILYLAPFLSYLPMAALSALLLMIAWNMSELPHLLRLLRISSRGDKALLLITLLLTVTVNMVAAVGIGVVLGALIFIRRMDTTVEVRELKQKSQNLPYELPENVCVLKFSGPLFFAGAERTLQNVLMMDRKLDTIIFYLEAVPIIDATGITCLEAVIQEMRHRDIRLILADLQPQPSKALELAGISPKQHWLLFEPSLESSLEKFNLNIAT